MTRVLALADDLTGALEVGARFGEHGLRALVTFDPAVRADAEALVIDTETRHLPAAEAAAQVCLLAREARRRGVPLIYKKTDSTLRGNIGAELGALVAADPASPLLYIPAYPEMGRTVRGGHLYVNGVPVEQTTFALDPLNPVRNGDIAGVLATQWGGPVRGANLLETAAPGAISVADGSTDEEVAEAARFVLQSGCALAAGPAALAGELAALLGGPLRPQPLPKIARCLVVNGSTHDAAARQVSRAIEAGWPLVPADGWAILDERWERIGETVARLVAQLEPDGLVIFGGDTACAIARALGRASFDPVCEVLPGVPLSLWGGLRVITKAGGFGSDSLLLQLRALLE